MCSIDFQAARYRDAAAFTPSTLTRNAHLSAVSSMTLLGRLACAVAGLGLDADQDRIVARLGRLQGRGELEAVRRHHAVVVVGRRDQGRRVARARLDVVQRAVGQQGLELIADRRMSRSRRSRPSRS